MLVFTYWRFLNSELIPELSELPTRLIDELTTAAGMAHRHVCTIHLLPVKWQS